VRLLFTNVDMPGSLDRYALARIGDMRWPGRAALLRDGGKEGGT